MAAGDKIQAVTVGVYINTGTDASPTWTKVGGQKSATLSFKINAEDATTKDSVDNWEENNYGSKSWAMRCDCLKVDSDLGQQAAVALMMSGLGKKVKLRWKDSVSALWEGRALLTGIEEGAPEKGSVTYKLDFTGDGKPTQNPSG
jgi:predicted secreted protein